MTGKFVWLASYPKSGNTWLRAVYTALQRGEEPDINALQGEILTVRAVFNAALGVRSSDLTHEEVQTLRPRADEAIAAQLTDRFWRKTHDALLPGPTGEPVISARVTRAALYIVRDPRDVAVSLAYHGDRSFERAVDFLSSDLTVNLAQDCSEQLNQRIGTWSQHVLSWCDQKHFPVHVLRYEDCLADPVPTFKRAFSLGGLEVSDEEVERAVASTSWSRLRDQEERGGFKERARASQMFFRRGVAGAWVDELPANLARRVERRHGAVMARFGYL